MGPARAKHQRHHWLQVTVSYELALFLYIRHSRERMWEDIEVRKAPKSGAPRTCYTTRQRVYKLNANT